uniref:hypothetical protein n=1 Tax=Barnesiella intestinihominis TaxID=487174 RepID=UPI003AB5A506
QKRMDEQSAYFKQILNIERGNCDRVRKDFYMMSAIYPEIKGICGVAYYIILCYLCGGWNGRGGNDVPSFFFFA